METLEKVYKYESGGTVTGADLEVRHSNTEESVFSYKRKLCIC